MNLLQPKDATFEKGKIDIAKLKQAEYYNKSAQLLQPLSVGETVRVKTPNRPWEKGTTCITGTNTETRSYEVKTEAGADYTRNRKHLRKSMEGPSNPDVPDDNPNCTSNDNKGTNPETNTNKDPETITTRSGREVMPPAKYNDFVKS